MVVVDCAPTAETIRLLTLPEVLSWYVERVMPTERALMRAARPILTRVSNLPVPEDRVFSSVEDVFAGIQAARDLLADPARSAARLVVNPEKMVIAEARRTYTYLGFFGYSVDSVIVNRVLPEAVDSSYFHRWRELQAAHLATIDDAFVDVDVLRLRLFDDEMVGLDRLGTLGQELYGDRHPLDDFEGGVPFEVEDGGEEVALSFSVPFVEGADIDVRQRGGELSVTVGQYRRSFVLPDAFRRRTVKGAKLSGGRLRIGFGPKEG